MRRYDIASILASTVLHPMIMEMRSQERTFLPSAVRRRLAYRELFLFRHYCERTMARDDFFSRERRLTDSKGSISKNLARAQRDLDFAALMSEDVERCLNHGDAAFESIGPSSAGQEVLRDQRLKLAHCGSIIDQLAIILMEQSKAPPLAALKVQGDLLSSRSRLDTWVLAGIVRETLADAQTALRARIQLSALRDTDQSAIRYHAYQEARSLQNVLLIFAIFLTFEISPPLHRLWTVECKLEPEQLLVFREWEDWWERFVSLNNMFDFELRAFPFLSAVLSSVIAIRRVAMEGSPRQHGKITDREAVVIKLLEDCKGTLAIMSKSQPKGLLSQLENQLWKRLTEIQIDIGSAG